MFDAYISIGFNCEAGLQFRRVGYEESSLFRFSFIKDFDSLANLIRSDFSALFLKDNLESVAGVMIRDKKTGISFHSPMAEYINSEGNILTENKAKYDRLYLSEKSKVDYLVDKWRKLVKSPQKVAYFYKPRDGSSKNEAELLHNLFRECYPNHDFSILYLQTDDLAEPLWGDERLHNVYLAHFAPFEDANAADESGWDEIFSEYPLNSRLKASGSASPSVTPVISQIVNIHRGGAVTHLTLLGLIRLREYAQMKKIPLEFVFVLDNSDELTTRIVKDHPLISNFDQIIEVNNRDLGLSRNSGVTAARGEYVGTMDEDDYYSANWPVAALEVVRNAETPVVVHPELQISFGSTHCVAHLVDMNKDQFSPALCLSDHPWISCLFAMKEIFVKHKYLRTDARTTGFGYEDWHWNVEVLADGIKHVCAPETAHFYRRKSESLLTSMVSSGAIIRPSAFFDRVDLWDEFNAGGV